jgi:hypothetical protein
MQVFSHLGKSHRILGIEEIAEELHYKDKKIEEYPIWKRSNTLAITLCATGHLEELLLIEMAPLASGIRMGI